MEVVVLDQILLEVVAEVVIELLVMDQVHKEEQH